MLSKVEVLSSNSSIVPQTKIHISLPSSGHCLALGAYGCAKQLFVVFFGFGSCHPPWLKYAESNTKRKPTASAEEAAPCG